MSPEQALHMAVARFLTAALPPSIPWTTFPAGGGGKQRGASLKAMGLKAGWPDLIFVGEGGRLYGIELKDRTGVLTFSQKEMHPLLRAAGVPAAVCRSVDAVELQLRAWGFSLKATVFPKADAA